jgi:multimeric flavodoxin WrbA
VDDEGLRRLLVVHHTPSPAVRALFEAVVAGTALPELAEVSVVDEPALSATAWDVLNAEAYLLVTPANIGYMSGALKHFFDTIYYPCMDATAGRPWGLIVHGNDDTAGAVRSIERIVSALKWRQVAPVLSVVGPPDAAALHQARDVAATVAAALLPG